MSERTRVEEPRHDATTEWEVFAREASADPLRHVGSITAATAESAHDHAGRLFPEASTLWLCPSEEVARFTERTLGAEAEEETADGDGHEPPTQNAGVEP